MSLKATSIFVPSYIIYDQSLQVAAICTTLTLLPTLLARLQATDMHTNFSVLLVVYWVVEEPILAAAI